MYHFFLFPFFLFATIQYRHIETQIPQSIHVLEVDPQEYEICPAKACDMGLGRESVQSLATRHGAIAAVNGGFFTIGDPYEGTASGILKIDGKWYGWPVKTRGAIGWNDHTFLFGKPTITAHAEIGQNRYPLSGINQKRKGITLYSRDFAFTTLTPQEGLEVIAENGKVSSTNKGGSSPIPKEGWVLSFPFEYIPSTPISPADPVSLHIACKPTIWEQCTHIVGGTPLLIEHGKRITDFSDEKTIDSFLNERHARTAVGLLPNGHLLFVAVDGKQPELSLGMTIDELSNFFEDIGCTYALNLDGGGSTTLFYDQKVVNHPYGDEDEDDKKQKIRKVGDAILIFKK